MIARRANDKPAHAAQGVTNAGDGTVWRIDPRTHAVLKLSARGTPTGVVVAGGRAVVCGRSSFQLRAVMMSRVTRRVFCVLAGVLLFASVAVAATPIKNGIYSDNVHGVSVILAGTNPVTIEVTCHGKHWVPPRGLDLKSGGRFSYSGHADKVSGQNPPTPTKTKMTVSGHFNTAHLVTGKAKVGGCSVQYSAKYVGSHP
jgi:hypothetical protein